jgi:TolB-like protein
MLLRLAFGLLLVCALIVPGSSGLAAVKTFAVSPFQVHGPDKYSYLSQGIQSMLTSRLTWEDHLEPVQSETARQPVASQSAAQDTLNELGADYLLYGSVTIMGQESSLDVHLLDTEKNQRTKSAQAPLNDLIPTLEGLAKDINNDIFGRKDEPKEAAQQAPEAPSAAANPNFIVNQDEKQSNLNPQFRYSGKSAQQGRWRSQSLPFDSNGMVAGDADGDGKSEMFLLQDHSVKAFTFYQNRLKPLDEYDVGRNIKCLNINLLDMNRDGYAEIIVSAIHDDLVKSFILNFKENALQVAHEDIDMFLNVLRLPPEYMKTLVGQKKGHTRLFDSGVHIVDRMSGEYRLGREIKLPEHTNVFNFCFLPQKDGHKIIVAGNRDHLRVYSSELDRQATTQHTYAGSSISLEVSNALPGLGENMEDPKKFYYIPTRLIPTNIDRDGQFELLVNRNISVSSRFFSRYRFFPQGEIHSLYWDGVGLNIQWKTRTIKGSVMDYGLEDVDNDDQTELFVCVNTHPGATGLKDRKTIVLAYSLNIDAAEQKAIVKPRQ